MKVVLDTNIIIAQLGADKRVLEELAKLAAESADFFISSVSLAELLAYPKISKNEISKVLEITKWISVIDVNYEIAVNAGNLIREKAFRLGDSIIIATADKIDAIILSGDKSFRKLGQRKARVI